MKEYFWILGSLCVLYYLILVIYSRRLRSTFAVFLVVDRRRTSVFWMCAASCICGKCFGWICLGLWIPFSDCGNLKICLGMFSKPERGAQWIIILGAQVRGRKITDSLKRRLDAAIHYLEENERTMVVVSGGRGPGEDISEADAMEQYLIEQGVAENRIRRKISPFLQEKI